jgi:hypothetical protein
MQWAEEWGGADPLPQWGARWCGSLLDELFRGSAYSEERLGLNFR